jgi:hypothetical protein
MNLSLKVPTRDEAGQLMAEAESRNPGRWAQHSRYVAQAAELIAVHAGLDPEVAFVMGYLHDIGRRAGVTDLRHALDGYRYLLGLGYDDAARICLTHSFPVQDARSGSGVWDCSEEEYQFVADFLLSVDYTEYDRLIQLCDAIAQPDGFCLIEKRLVDVALRHGINAFTVQKWDAFLRLQKDFEEAMGQSIYRILPGVVINTFGFDPVKG